MNRNNTVTFDPSEIIRGIQQLLISDKKKIGFLFGAGTSNSKKTNTSPIIPTIIKMTEEIEDRITKNIIIGEKFKKAIIQIKDELKNKGINYNIESLLTNIEGKIEIIGYGTLNDLNIDEFKIIQELIRVGIKELVSVHKNVNNDNLNDIVHYDFAQWINKANRRNAVEIFTTNYDYLLEIGLEALRVPYYDGFTGSYYPFFNPTSVEDLSFLTQQTKLWKIHGSLGLHEEFVGNENRIIRNNSKLDDLLIYPSSLKYANSKKQPYSSFQDRLNSFLKQDDSVLFVCGYSFGDEHINERIMSALSSETTAHVFALIYDIIYKEDSDGKLIKYNSLSRDSAVSKLAFVNRKISVLSSRSAIIGGVFGEWRLKREPSVDDFLNIYTYFDEDAPINLELNINEKSLKGEIWTGCGELTLPNFSKFTQFLVNMIPKNEWEKY